MSFKIKYDSTEVDRSKSSVEAPKPGLYKMKITEVNEKDGNSGAQIEFVCRIIDNKAKKSKNYGFWDRVALSKAAAWKLDQYLLAVGIDTTKKTKGTIDSSTFLNKEIMGRVKSDYYDGEYRPKLAAVFEVVEDDEDEDEDLDEDELDEDEDELDEEEDFEEDEDEEEEDELDEEDEEEEDEEEEEEEEPPARPAKKASAKKAPAPAKKAPAKKAAARKPKYEDMDIDDLRAECKSRGLSTKGTVNALVARLRANDEDPFDEE